MDDACAVVVVVAVTSRCRPLHRFSLHTPRSRPRAAAETAPTSTSTDAARALWIGWLSPLLMWAGVIVGGEGQADDHRGGQDGTCDAMASPHRWSVLGTVGGGGGFQGGVRGPRCRPPRRRVQRCDLRTRRAICRGTRVCPRELRSRLATLGPSVGCSPPSRLVSGTGPSQTVRRKQQPVRSIRLCSESNMEIPATAP